MSGIGEILNKRLCVHSFNTELQSPYYAPGTASSLSALFLLSHLTLPTKTIPHRTIFLFFQQIRSFGSSASEQLYFVLRWPLGTKPKEEWDGVAKHNLHCNLDVQ